MSWQAVVLALATVLGACGVATTNVAPTQTRTAELAQLATLTAPTATPHAVATQTRAVELAQIATLTAPTATPHVSATQTRAAELAQLATFTAPTPTRLATTPSIPDTTAGVGTFLGSLEKSEALIGIVTDGRTLRAYVCDGSSVAQWFTGPLTSGTINLASTEGTRLRGTFDPNTNQITGDVEFSSGDRLPFSSLRASGPGNNGLYRATGTANGQSFTMGVIVLPDGRSAGAFRQNDKLTPVTNPQFAAGTVTAAIPGVGAVTAQRITTP